MSMMDESGRGPNVLTEYQWVPTIVGRDRDGFQVGKTLCEAGQVCDLANEECNGGLYTGGGPETSGRVALRTKSGNIYYIQHGLIIDVRQALRGMNYAVVIAECPAITIGQSWSVGSPKGVRIGGNDPIVSVSIASLKHEPTPAAEYGDMSPRMDSVFTELDAAFAIKGVNLVTLMTENAACYRPKDFRLPVQG